MALQHPAFLNCLSVVDKAAMGNNTVGKSVVDGVDRGSMDEGSSVDSVGNNRGVVDNWVGNSVDGVDRGSGNVATSRGRGGDGFTGGGDLSNVAGQVVGVVSDGLDPAVGKVDRVGAIPEAGSIVSLSLLEGSTRVFISHTILEGVGRDLGQVVVADSMSHRMSYSGMHHRSGHRVHHRPCHSDWSGNSHAMADKAMTSNEAMSSHKTVSSHKTMSCQQLGGGRGGSSQGSDTKEGLRG